MTSMFFFAGGCFLYFTFIPCLSFGSFHDPCPFVLFDVSHDSGLCRFLLACMGLVFSFMSDMFRWRKRLLLCVTETIHLTFVFFNTFRRIRKSNLCPEWYLKKSKTDAATRHADQNPNHHCMTVETPSFSCCASDLIGTSLSPLTFLFPFPFS
jgi:hypothetical protein